MALDRLSCSRFRANQFRLLLTAAAYILFQGLRLAARGTAWATAQVPTLRERLLKIGVWLERSVRRVVVHFPATLSLAAGVVRARRRARRHALTAAPLGPRLTTGDVSLPHPTPRGPPAHRRAQPRLVAPIRARAASLAPSKSSRRPTAAPVGITSLPSRIMRPRLRAVA